MPEGENKDDLFEDLDKFFAPIQDVDWPDTTTPEDEPTSSNRHDEAPDQTASFDEITLPESEPVGDEPALPRDDEPDPASLLESSGVARDEDDEDISVDSFTQPPSAYVDLPGAEEDVEADLDEPMLEEPMLDEAPSAEAVEAAVDHFAESVRDEVDVDQPETTSYITEAIVPGAADDEEELVPEERSSVRTVRVGAGAEGLGGPSWQEPSTMEVGTLDERRTGGRDVPAAFLTGLVLAALAVGSIAIDPAAFAVVAGLIVLWAQGELYRALQKEHHQPATALGLVSGALILAAGYFRGEAAMLSIFALSIVATFVWYMATPESHRKGTTTNVALTVLGIAYVPLLAGYALVLLEQTDGPALVLSVLALTFVYDTGAFVVGSWWGSRPLAPTISPKKSVEGAIGATLIVIAVAAGAIAAWVHPLTHISDAVGLAVIVAIFAPLGDLAESLLKRDLGVKDMGSVLPGHGGVLDRIDSLLFVAPAAFLFLRLILT
ncbi:MAG: phosphatidate cytidylyltransferase [Actinomycetota bacterium]